MTMVTNCFNMMEGNTISVAMTVRQGLLVMVHTLKHGASSDATGGSPVLCHEVSIVLSLVQVEGQRYLAGIIITVGLVDT